MFDKGYWLGFGQIFFCFVLLWGIACKKNQVDTALPPDSVLVDLLCDLHLAEASLNRINADLQDSVALKVRERIATSYGITPVEMDDWLEALQKSPEHNTSIYDSVIVELERRIAD